MSSVDYTVSFHRHLCSRNERTTAQTVANMDHGLSLLWPMNWHSRCLFYSSYLFQCSCVIRERQVTRMSLFPFIIRRSSLASWSLKATSSWVRNWRSSWRITPSCELPCQPIRRLQELTHRTSSVLLLAFWSVRAALHFASRGTLGTVTHWDEKHFKVEFFSQIRQKTPKSLK